MLFVDLDRFKVVNDTYGHEVGDELMESLAGRMADWLPARDVLVRYGGDEFVAVCRGVADARAAARLAQSLIDLVEAPFAIGADRIQISLSVGVALSDGRRTDGDELIRQADTAMYEAKAADGVVVFDPTMAERGARVSSQRRLQVALEQDQFELHYQPVVSLPSQQVVKVEALLRWLDPDRGLVGPAEFIPALEESGLIISVGRWVMEQAARQAQAWAAGPSGVSGAPIGVTVNVSARQLSQYDFPEMTESILQETGVSPELLTLEITEGALMRDVDAAWSVLRRVKTLGLSLALDDFGTGFSSLSFLRRFDLDMVKIDKSFVDGIGQSREDTTIVEHLIGMAQGLGLVTVAEGVETEGQAQYLARLECPLAQGYYYARPQPVAAIERILDWQASTVSTPSIGVGPGSVDTVGQGSV